jgi:hypothetical protein
MCEPKAMDQGRPGTEEEEEEEEVNMTRSPCIFVCKLLLTDPLVYARVEKLHNHSNYKKERKKINQPKTLLPPAPQAVSVKQAGCQIAKEDDEPNSSWSACAEADGVVITPASNRTAVDKGNEKQQGAEGEEEGQHERPHVEEVNRLAHVLVSAMSRRSTGASDSTAAPTAQFWCELQARVETLRTGPCVTLVTRHTCPSAHALVFTIHMCMLPGGRDRPTQNFPRVT